MRAVIINTFDISGGAARAAYDLHKGFSQVGVNSHMLVRYKLSNDNYVVPIVGGGDKNHIDEFYLSTIIQNHYINNHRTNLSNTLFSYAYPGYDLSKMHIVDAADLINLHWIAYFQSPLTLHNLFSLGKPVVWTLHDQWPFTGGCHYTAGCEAYFDDCISCPQLSEDPFNLPAAVLKDKRDLFQGANLTIVAPSQWLASCAKNSKLFGGLRVETIPYSIRTDFFTPMSKSEAKKNLGISPDTKTILFGANADERRKGMSELIAALHHCMTSSTFQEMALTGKVNILTFGRICQELKTIGIPVTSIGSINSNEELRQAYVAADIFVLPSLEDNMPYTMLESMSCGLPVVAFNVGGMPDVIENDVVGKIVPVGDIKGLGEVILSLISDSNLLDQFGNNCRKLMVDKFSLQNQAARYLELYEDLASRNPPKKNVASVPVESAQKNVEESLSVQVPIVTEIGYHCCKIYDPVLTKSLKEHSLIMQEQMQKSEATVQAIYSSLSWKITAPLRWLATKIFRFWL